MNVLYETYLDEKRKNEQLSALLDMVDKSLSKHYKFFDEHPDVRQRYEIWKEEEKKNCFSFSLGRRI